ncbi:pullulanase-type alpha-1,6-glucosidase [Calothrix rhizosoleniae]|uniref:pullulanase-type alpha-1,6-glucosidase n=2 Tax=Calothrix rhizosoleniae TaxID=888997 RepID=UPI00190ED2B7|nr:pullulanase-type alpha-1,6-glucosidase [Calothrix rhizosoleniae]
MLIAFIAFIIIYGYHNTSFASSDAGWQGEMFPAVNSSNITTDIKSFTVDVQLQPAGARNTQLNCNLSWSQVDSFGGEWKQTITTGMKYQGKNNYQSIISPPIGLYEFTSKCTHPRTKKTIWQSPGNGKLTVKPLSTELSDRRAFWVKKDIIAWNSFGATTYELHHSPNGNLSLPLSSGAGIPLKLTQTLTNQSYTKFPQLNRYDGLQIPTNSLPQIPEILRGEIAIAAYDQNGKLLDATGIQIQGVLDDLYTYSGELGVIYRQGIPTLKLWAPTAKSVTLHRFADTQANTTAIKTPMTFDSQTGVWSITGDTSWNQQYYLYEVQVFAPTTGKIATNLVTDPYAVSLSLNSDRSQIVDINNDKTLQPNGWDTLVKPTFTAPVDISIYEVHIRDFSRDDQTVAASHRGKYKAFTYDGKKGRPGPSDGMTHLLNLGNAGLTHIHLMPTFDLSTINEDPNQQNVPEYQYLNSFPPNSPRQQAVIAATRDRDAFNWGYDPFHYGVPEGSYGTMPNNTSRIREFREMVQTLNENGLRVVMDVVYNHTTVSGQDSQSVLDRIVPGYYYRYNQNGELQNTSCCPDTASEFAMMSKLMIDTVMRWAKAYKIDGFRFDLMNLHTVDNMIALRDVVQGLTVAKDGVDGSKIYLYGEGWDFGSLKANGFKHGEQFNMAGTGIGTFNDRIRNGAHGGYSKDPLGIRRQGFINGQFYDWNGYFYDQRNRHDLLDSTDKIRLGLAGNLQDFQFISRNDKVVKGKDLNGAGYTTDPQEAINYVSKHDNETLYDLNVFRMPSATMEERVQAQNMGISIIGLSQGIPFFHMGSDMLRSKSLDSNSYDSGDWFNRIDFTYNSNNFGVGLPPAWDNQSRWQIMEELLANKTLIPSKSDILKSVNHLQEILQIRQSSKLFRLETSAEIKKRLQFHNTGSQQKDGLIVMSISDRFEPDLDPNYEYIVVLFNANKIAQTFTLPELKGVPMELHPVQQNKRDTAKQPLKQVSFNRNKGEFNIPPRTTAVFCLK